MAGAAGVAAFHRARRDATDGAFQALFHVAIPTSAVERFHDQLRELGVSRDTPVGSLLNLGGPRDEDIAVSVDTRSVAATKLSGIEAHRTQIGELEQVPEEARWLLVETEWFVRAWPPRDPGEPVATDPFRGVVLARPSPGSHNTARR